jgi:hypothetical protein
LGRDGLMAQWYETLDGLGRIAKRIHGRATTTMTTSTRTTKTWSTKTT